MAYLLIAEDEPAIHELMQQNLRLVGHEVDSCYHGQEALELAKKNRYDLILLDVMLPGIQGFDVKQQLDPEQPVIFVTAKSSLQSRLKGLGLGADDYIVKPFEMLELLARVEAVLRRTKRNTKQFSLAGVTIEFDTRLVTREDAVLELTPREYELMETLVLNRNLALSRDRLLELVWGYDYDGDARTVDVHIQRLRKKLGWDKEIQTVYKLGYRLNAKI